MTYDVALLIEHRLHDIDADQVVALHEELQAEENVVYHVLLPVVNSTRAMIASMASLGDGNFVPLAETENLDSLEREVRTEGQCELDASTALIHERDQECTGRITDDEPVSALVAFVDQVHAAEVIIVTQSHLVREFFHVDWTSRAKRHLKVPTLHLLEHVPFDAQF